MPRDQRILTIGSDPDCGEILARNGDPQAHSILQRAGFVPVIRLHDSHHRLPLDLTEDEETQRASEAVARLCTAGYQVACDPEFVTSLTVPQHPVLGAQVADLAERIRAATTTEEAAKILTELTAPHDGILAGIEEVLLATAEFHEDLGDAADPYVARRLRHLAEERLGVIRSDLAHTRNELADRHTEHPRRSACTREVPATEREASAVCACSPPPRKLPIPPPPVTSLRR